MKLIIDVPIENADRANRINCEAVVVVSLQHLPTATVIGSVDGWKSDGRTSRRLCATYAGAKADAAS